MTLAAFGLNCTLKSGPQKSSTQKLLDLMLRALSNHCVDTSYERAVDHDMKLSVSADEGEGCVAIDPQADHGRADSRDRRADLDGPAEQRQQVDP
jgi:hypothetical protein